MRGSRSFSELRWPRGRWRGSAVRGLGTAAGQLDLAAVGQRGVQAGAGTELVLTDGGGGTHVGTEVTDRLGQLAQPVGERPGDALRRQLLRRPGQPAND